MDADTSVDNVRGISRMKYLFAGTFILLLVGCTQECGVEEDGNKLYMNRSGSYETYRAQFCYAQDCRLIAKNMNAVERATLFCKLFD